MSGENSVEPRAARVERRVTSRLPTRFGVFSVHGYRDLYSGIDHVALVRGEITAEPILVRIHSECLTGESFGSLRCDCRMQLDGAMEKIAATDRGVIVYLRGHEGRGIGLINKLRAYALQDEGQDTARANSDLGLPVDARDYTAAFGILEDLGVRSLRLMTNNPEKIRAAERAGMPVVERIPLFGEVTHHNAGYLRTKMVEFGHLLPDL